MAVEECYEIHDNSPYLNQRWLYAAAEIFPQILTISKARKDRKKGCLRLQNHVQVENYYRLQVGDVILYQKTTILQQDGDSRATKLLRARTGSDLSIVFENSQYAVIRKPAGFHVKGRGLYSVEALARDVLTPSDRKDALPYPNAVHRLDCRVSGVLLIAKTRLADASFGRQFEKKRVQKCYRAIVVGKLEERDVIQETDRDTLLAMYPVDNPERVYVIQQNVGDRFALTYYRIVSHSRSCRYDWITTVEMYPVTGRQHQLRLHLAQALQHPIVGDDLYHGKIQGKVLKKSGLFLQAIGISFTDPESKEKVFYEISEAEKFEKYRSSSSKSYFRSIDMGFD